MSDDRVHFEFYYEFGQGQAGFHHGWLPREEFEALTRGAAPLRIRVHDVTEWDPNEGKFLRRGPGGSAPAGEPWFHSERMTRVWPVAPVAEPGAVVREEDLQPPPLLRKRLEDFFGGALREPRIVQESMSDSDLPNFERAVADFLQREATSHVLLGVQAPEHFDYRPGLRQVIARRNRHEEEYSAVRVGSPEWKRLPVDLDDHRDCLSRGLYLLETRHGKAVLAAWPEQYGQGEGTKVEVLTLDAGLARAILDDLREGMARLSIYRGKVIELQPVHGGCGYQVGFATLRVPERSEIVLPEGQLELVERNALAALRHRDRLLGAGRHLRRGLLFHGKPGTGKTLTARYLVGRLERYTVVLLTGPTLGLLPQACRLARALSPSAVIVEDVDLIARERGKNETASLLHNLLDEMDGLSPKIEMVFLLTTNRPDMLEPALASRPGRIDQAIEFHLPDKEARRRLFQLFARGLPLAADLESFLERTEGASGAFIEELLRRALVFAAEGGAPEVRDDHVEQALRELVLSGGVLTRSLLGFTEQPSGKDGTSGPAR